MTNNKVLVGMSGGVDSAVAAMLLKEKYEPTGVTLSLWCRNADKEEDENAEEAKKTASLLGFEHMTVSLEESFKENVVDRFIRDYRQGKTPNPCVECNKHIKFGKMFELAHKGGFGYLATGHYARIVQSNSGEYFLCRAKDSAKDQSYFLWGIKKEILPYLLFPIGEYTKSEVREIASANGFCNASRSDSQDICFIEDGDYASFLARYDSPLFKEGNFVGTNGNILGKHAGLERYTIGQRKGLGIALGKPMFVGKKNAKSGDVMLCTDAELYSSALTASSLNFLCDIDITKPFRCFAKIRYRHTPAAATAVLSDTDTLSLVFDEPQRAICQGQSLVLYDGDILLGGGIIN